MLLGLTNIPWLKVANKLIAAVRSLKITGGNSGVMPVVFCLRYDKMRVMMRIVAATRKPVGVFQLLQAHDTPL
jgi:hypothetical protein